VHQSVQGDEDQYRIRVVDDKSIDSDSLGLRRAKLKQQGVTLHPIGTAIFFIADLVKLAKSTTWFIDKEGNIFQYKKSTRAKLIYRPISQILPINSGGAIIEVKGIPSRFKSLHMPTTGPTHAGLLSIGTGYILYGLYDKEYDSSYRVI
jgi:hypothetical protein